MTEAVRSAPALRASRSLARVASARSARRAARTLFGGLLVLTAGLAFVPWRQTVPGSGEVVVFAPMDRPQTVEAQIPGRLVEWRVQEGDLVAAGQIVARLEDIDSKFLDGDQPRRIREQREFAEATRRESAERIAELEEQRRELEKARTSAIGAATGAIAQAQARERSAGQSVRAAEGNLRIAERVAAGSARERAAQAEDRIVQADQALQAAVQNARTALLRRDRVRDLVAKGLNSRQGLEFAENDLTKADTETARARKSLAIARRDLSVGALAQEGAALETERARAALQGAKEAREVARTDVVNARLNLSRLVADTAAGLSRVGADIQSARESFAKNGGDLRKAENEEGNIRGRAAQRTVRAPRAGRVVRLLEVGAGGTVKAGDVLATIAPETKDRMVALYVSDNDVPLVAIGRKVRLQFAGWPALQVSGLPGVAAGSFGGEVAFVDPVPADSSPGGYGGGYGAAKEGAGAARYRVLVRPDRQILTGGRYDDPWPDPARLRPGAEAYGWIMLDSVPLGTEIWRQFNRFPPRIPREGKDAKSKDPQLGPIKVKSK